MLSYNLLSNSFYIVKCKVLTLLNVYISPYGIIYRVTIKNRI